MSRIPLFRPSMGREELANLAETLRTGWLGSGPLVRRFQEKLADLLGVEHLLCTSSGTAALECALILAGVNPGDEVITSAIDYPAAANIILRLGAAPVFADVDPYSGNVSVESVRELIGERTRAVVAGHLTGNPCDIDGIESVCREHRVPLVFDCAHAFGATYRSRSVACRGDYACFSFYPNKSLTTGDGGALVTRGESDFSRAMTILNNGIDRWSWDRFRDSDPGHWETVCMGIKGAMNDIAAAIGLGQLTHLGKHQERRGRLFEMYDGLLSEIPGVTPLERNPDGQHSCSIYSVILTDECPVDRDGLRSEMAGVGIETGVHFRSLADQRFAAGRCRFGRLDGAGFFSERCLSLPLYPSLEDSEAERVIRALKDALMRAKVCRA